MTKKKTILVTCMVLVVAMVGILAVSSLAFAAGSSGTTQSVQSRGNHEQGSGHGQAAHGAG